MNSLQNQNRFVENESHLRDQRRIVGNGSLEQA